MRGALERFADGNGFWAGVRFEQKLAGCVILNQIDWGHLSADIGYWLGREYQGQGLVALRVEAAVKQCFEDLALHRLEIRVAQENIRSRRVPERLGFREEGLLRQANRLHGTYVDLVVFSMLAHEWKEARE
ncbi:MAG: GNAT family protein [Planctomycetota bacterium]